MYFTSTQVTILVQVTFYVVSSSDDDDKEPALIRETHYYLSNDRSHDTLFVQHCLLQHSQCFTSDEFRAKTHYVFSDGCAGQFKGAWALYFAARWKNCNFSLNSHLLYTYTIARYGGSNCNQISSLFMCTVYDYAGFICIVFRCHFSSWTYWCLLFSGAHMQIPFVYRRLQITMEFLWIRPWKRRMGWR